MYGVRFFVRIFIVLSIFINKTISFVENGDLKIAFIEGSTLENNDAVANSTTTLLPSEQKIDENSENLQQDDKTKLNDNSDHEDINFISEKDKLTQYTGLNTNGIPHKNDKLYRTQTQSSYNKNDETNNSDYDNNPDEKEIIENPEHNDENIKDKIPNETFNLNKNRKQLLLGSIIGKDFNIHIREQMIRELISNAKYGIKGIIKLMDNKYVGRLFHDALIRLNIAPETVLDGSLISFETYNEILSTIFLIMTEMSFKEYDFFYKSLDISQKLKKISLKKLKVKILKKLGVTYNRLPPIIKNPEKECPVKNIVISISSKELAQRMAIMFAKWLSLEEYGSIVDFNHNVELNLLCSGAPILLQQWKYYQMLLGFEENNEHAFLNLIDNLLTIDKKYNENQEFHKLLKKIKKSKVFQYCIKLMRVAGSISSVPFSHENLKIKSTSLIGSLGNLTKIQIGSYDVAVSKRLNSYFIYSQKKSKKNISLKVIAVCNILHIINLVYTCSNERNKSIIDLYKLQLNTLTIESWRILNSLINLSFLSKENNLYLKEMCTPNNSLINETLNKLLVLVSSESHELLINEMEKRGLNEKYFKEEEEKIIEEEKFQKEEDTEVNNLIFE